MRLGSRRTARTRRIVLGLAVGWGLAVAAAGTVSAADEDVAISGFSFSPRDVTISVGDTVTWTNSDAQAHTATADEGAAFDTSSIANDASSSITFDTAGTFAYHCDFHPEMTGRVVVQDGLPPTDAQVAQAQPAPAEPDGATVIALALVLGGGLLLGLRRFSAA